MKDYKFSDGIGFSIVAVAVAIFICWASSVFTKVRIEDDCQMVGRTIINGHVYECAPVSEEHP